MLDEAFDNAQAPPFEFFDGDEKIVVLEDALEAFVFDKIKDANIEAHGMGGDRQRALAVFGRVMQPAYQAMEHFGIENPEGYIRERKKQYPALAQIYDEIFEGRVARGMRNFFRKNG